MFDVTERVQGPISQACTNVVILLRLRLSSWNRILELTPRHRQQCLQGSWKSTLNRGRKKKIAMFNESCFLVNHIDGYIDLQTKQNKMALGSTVDQIQDSDGGIMMWVMFSWDTLRSIILLEQSLTTVCYMSINEDYVPSFKATFSSEISN
ncbi:hypothetical protein TNCV_648941 [Trichonephila clavipes]|uniref:Uncharacterized protein n=1 Tax=Trichonephila clavipes TaxID=2585209 RepID=A0A8X6SMG8_TRICX|nr:hypothetical protein TNCV_648941 [Trichonephila clavipes]